MIRKLTGLVDSITDEGVILDVNGVGYQVLCPAGLARDLLICGQKATLWIETQMSEHAISLYGFASQHELEWFRLLVSVHGVGNRVALGLLGALTLGDLTHAITAGDGAVLGTVSGIGKKLAVRIVNELKDKLPAPLAEIVPLSTSIATSIAKSPNSALASAISALVNLGYPEQRARIAVGKIMAANANPPPVAEIIRASLRELAQ